MIVRFVLLRERTGQSSGSGAPIHMADALGAFAPVSFPSLRWFLAPWGVQVWLSIEQLDKPVTHQDCFLYSAGGQARRSGLAGGDNILSSRLAWLWYRRGINSATFDIELT